MRKTRRSWLGLGLSGALAAGAALGAGQGEAHACGGCFAPSESTQVVTDHRMAMAINDSYAVLWDQIQFTGNPEDFSWVLPVHGDVTVEVASDAFFTELEQQTAVTVRGPFVRTSCGGGGGFACGAAAPSLSSAGSGAEDRVQVLNMASVGPYQTVTLRSADTGALTTWLRDNQYTVPTSLEPVIQWYTDRHMDFVALRLRPGVGVQAMQPVRIRFATPNMVLPLRMVAAGVADKVGITLWVLGASRFEAANFANARIDPGELVWNWDTNRSNYRELFTQTLTRTNGGRAWITEYANQVPYYGTESSSSGSYQDWNLARAGLGTSMMVTRLRTDLAVALLDADLQLQPSATNETVSNVLSATRETGHSPAVTCGGLVTIATPADAARRPGHVLAGLAASALALAVARRRARKAAQRANDGTTRR